MKTQLKSFSTLHNLSFTSLSARATSKRFFTGTVAQLARKRARTNPAERLAFLHYKIKPVLRHTDRQQEERVISAALNQHYHIIWPRHFYYIYCHGESWTEMFKNQFNNKTALTSWNWNRVYPKVEVDVDQGRKRFICFSLSQWSSCRRLSVNNDTTFSCFIMFLFSVF